MNERARLQEFDVRAPNVVDFDEYASYEDGDGVVICDRTNTNAWIRSETVTAVER